MALTKLEATPSTSTQEERSGEDVLMQLGTKDFIHNVNHTLGLAATTQADPAQLYSTYSLLIANVIFELSCLSDVSSTQHYLQVHGKLWTCTYINLLLTSISILQDLKARGKRI